MDLAGEQVFARIFYKYAKQAKEKTDPLQSRIVGR